MRAAARLDPPDTLWRQGAGADEKLRILLRGAPRGLELTLGAGLISGKQPLNGEHYLQTTAPISPAPMPPHRCVRSEVEVAGDVMM